MFVYARHTNDEGVVEVFFLAVEVAPPPPVCRADLDGNGNIGYSDLATLLNLWGANPGGPPDFDGDGVVAVPDLLTLLAAWGACS